MRLSRKEELERLAHGCCAVREEQRGVFFDRMNAPLREFYDSREALRVRARCPAGVRIRFRSDTSWLEVSLKYGDCCREIFKADLVVDGAWIGSFGPDEPAGGWSGEIFRAKEEATREFDLWLPHMVETWVQWIEIDDGALVEPILPADQTWLAIGDSITQGIFASTPAGSYAAVAARLLSVNLHNVGVGGATMEGLVGAAAAQVPCSFASVAFGVNDWSQSKPLDRFRQDSLELLSGLSRNQAAPPVALVTPLPVLDRPEKNALGLRIEDYRAELREITTQSNGVILIEGPALLPAEEKYFVDGVHPNAAGMKPIGEQLARELDRRGSFLTSSDDHT